MNSLLVRQLRKHLPGFDPTQAPWADFLAAVSAAYDEGRQDNAFLAHTLEVASNELTEANERIRRDAENQLSAVHRYFQQTLEFQLGMILCVRRTARGFEHTLCRGQLARRIGLDPSNIEGRTVDEVAPPLQAAQLNAAFARAWAGEEHAFSFTTSDGIELYIAMRPRREAGAVEEVIASCIEITALKQAEHELRAAKERAETADRAKSEFLAVMSHEIRTPLNAVLGFSSLLQQTPLNEEQQGWLQTIDASGASLLALIDDILDFSKIEAGRLTLHPGPLELPALLEDIVGMFRPRAAQKALACDLVVAPNVPTNITTDAQRLRQVLVNLLGNAVKFTARGSVRLMVFRGASTPDDPPRTCRIRFAVRDSGIGIPREKQPLLFKPFSQVDSSSTRVYGGTGLGLAICHRLVHLLGGDISVASAAGTGSTFSFSIRAGVDEALAPVLPDAPPDLPAEDFAPADGFRILVAEDDPQNRTLISQIMKRRHLDHDLVENGRAAVAAAITGRYPLIFLDLQMPELNGYEAAAAIRAGLPAGARAKIFALTANIFPDDLRRCLAAGMDGTLAKPIAFAELYATIASVRREFTAP